MKIKKVYLGRKQIYPDGLRSTLPITPSYENDKFTPIFVPKEDGSKYAGYLFGWTGNKLYALDMYTNNSDWVDLGTAGGNSNFGFDYMGINIATGDQLIARQGQRSNTYGIFNVNGTNPTYSTVTATSLPTNTYSDFSYINTYKGIFLQKDGNTSTTESSSTWRRYDWNNKTVTASGNLTTDKQSCWCADDPINPTYLYRGGGSNHTSRTTNVYKFTLSNNTVTQIGNLPGNTALNQPFYYNNNVFFPIKTNFNTTYTQVYKYNLSNNQVSTINLGTTGEGYHTRKQFYLDKYLYIFPSGAQGIVIDMSTL